MICWGVFSLILSYAAVAIFVEHSVYTHLKIGIIVLLMVDLFHRSFYFVAKSYVPYQSNWKRAAHLRSTISALTFCVPLIYTCIYGDAVPLRITMAIAIIANLLNGACVATRTGNDDNKTPPLPL